ncbi:MAG: hypothetical protein RL299_279 [Pseudomonadota bacterium]
MHRPHIHSSLNAFCSAERLGYTGKKGVVEQASARGTEVGFGAVFRPSIRVDDVAGSSGPMLLNPRTCAGSQQHKHAPWLQLCRSDTAGKQGCGEHQLGAIGKSACHFWTRARYRWHTSFADQTGRPKSSTKQPQFGRVARDRSDAKPAAFGRSDYDRSVWCSPAPDLSRLALT